MKTFRDLLVWQKAIHFVTRIYKITKTFPQEEIYGLTSQMKRSTISIPSNIAEGYGKRKLLEYLHFISIAISSCNELEVFLLLFKDLNYLLEFCVLIISNPLINC